jgi:hypothetical protein
MSIPLVPKSSISVTIQMVHIIEEQPNLPEQDPQEEGRPRSGYPGPAPGSRSAVVPSGLSAFAQRYESECKEEWRWSNREEPTASSPQTRLHHPPESRPVTRLRSSPRVRSHYLARVPGLAVPEPTAG